MTNNMLVESLYVSILNRPADKLGRDHHVQRINPLSQGDALRLLIPEFLNSNEYRNNMHLTGLTSQSGEITHVVNHVVILGTHCYTSALLKRANLKRWSGPFDWIFSSPAMVSHILNDNFQKFLDRTYYKPIPLHERVPNPEYNRVEHEFYLDKFGIGSIFNHHEAHLDNDYQYFVRCVSRFRTALASPGKILFIVCTKRTEHTRDDFNILNAAIRNYRPGNFILKYIAIEETQALLPTHDAVIRSDSEELIYYQSTSEWLSTYFESHLDDIAVLRIISSGIKFDL